MDKRQQKILKALVYRYITTGIPVGSKSLAESLNLGISPATVRNELSKLEGMGYLYQPHTSAGRVPTGLGYRFYVDSLIGRARLREEEKKAVLRLFSNQTRELENLLQEASTLLSRLTKAASMIIAPRLSRNTIKHLDLVNLSGNAVLLVIITDTGRVEKKLIYAGEGTAPEGVEETQTFLNRRLQGKGLDELKSACPEQEIREMKSQDLTRKALAAVREILTLEEYEKVYVGGTVNLLKYLEEEGARRIENLLKHFEEQYFLLNMLSEALLSKELVVRIGEENLSKELQYFSLVTTPYGIGEEMVGAVSVLGPTRMDYARVIPTVDFIAKSLSGTLEVLKS